jgi:uncharacterized protein YjlB
MSANERSFFLKDDGQIPNNQELPVIIYEGVFSDNPNDMVGAFNRHNWTGSWSGGIYDYHHYHSNTHEVLGVRSGQATILLGGDSGERLEVKTGDVVLLPAGIGHQLVKATGEFEVIGAYPNGMTPNIIQQDPAGRAQALQEIRNVPVPETDPVYGDNGPLLRKWVK